MQISALGSNSRPQRRSDGFSAGFTLVEILLVLLIVGILAGTIVPTLSQRGASSKDEAVRLAAVIDHAQAMATMLGSPIGLRISINQYEFLQWSGTWEAIDSEHVFRLHSLPEGIVMELQREPDAANAIPQIIRFPPAGFPPKFRIRVSGDEHAWLVNGDLAGRVVVDSEESSP